MVALKPIIGQKYAAYRSTLQVYQSPELFAILDKEGFRQEIFNEKLSDFKGTDTNVYVVKYPPNVIVTVDENGLDHYGGFEIEMFNELAQAVNSKVTYYSNPEEYNFETQVANVTGNFWNIPLIVINYKS